MSEQPLTAETMLRMLAPGGAWYGCGETYLRERFVEYLDAARAGVPSLDPLVELEAYAHGHAALKAGRGSVDDIDGFIEWFRAASHD